MTRSTLLSKCRGLLARRLARAKKFYREFPGKQPPPWRTCRRLRSLTLFFQRSRSKDRSLRQLLQGMWLFSRCQGQALGSIHPVEILRLHWQALILPLQPWLDTVEVVRAGRVAGLAGGDLAHQWFGLAEVDDQAHGRHPCGVEVLAHGIGGRVEGGVVAAGWLRTSHGLAAGVLPLIAVKFAPLPGFMIATQLTVASGDRRRQAAGEDRRFVFFLRGVHIIPEWTVFAPQQVIGLRRVRQAAIGDESLPRRAALWPQFIEENLPGAFLQEQLVDGRIGGGRAEFAVKCHQAGQGLACLAAIRHGQGLDGLLARL